MNYLILGASGQLGREFQKQMSRSGVPFVAADRVSCDITSEAEVERLLDRHKPTTVINCAAYNQVDEAEDKPDLAFAVNAQAVKTLAVSCDKRRIKLVHYSTDYVFDGLKGRPYVEADRPNPLSVYAKSKLAGEEYLRNLSRDHLLFRVSWVIGPGRQNFLYKVRQWMEKSDTLRIAEDEVSVPTLADTVVQATLQALLAGLRGTFHLTNSGQASRCELVRYYLQIMGIKDKTVVPVPFSSFALKARRPGYSVMSNAALSEVLGLTIPDWRVNLREYLGQPGEGRDGSAG